MPNVLCSSVVKLLRIITALTVLAAWLPATSHCLLGAVELVPDTCCQVPHSSSDEPEQSQDDCGTCSNVESGDYKLGVKCDLTFSFHATLTWDLKLPTRPNVTLNAAQHVSSRAPPDFKRWQFLTRAALPGRAPAIL